MSKKSMSVADGVRRLALEHPDWLQVVAAAVAVAERTEAHGGEFAGAWVVNELNGRWVPNLRILVTYGLLEKSGESTRGGRRAYYRMPARREVQATLAELDAARSGQEPKLTFVGTGASGGGDSGRRAGETAFDPPPWR